MSGGSWDGMLQSLRRHGLDIVVAFDSTGSMQGEINQVKRQIGRIGSTLLTLVPKTRISICTYRDQGDEYVVPRHSPDGRPAGRRELPGGHHGQRRGR